MHSTVWGLWTWGGTGPVSGGDVTPSFTPDPTHGPWLMHRLHSDRQAWPLSSPRYGLPGTRTFSWNPGLCTVLCRLLVSRTCILKCGKHVRRHPGLRPSMLRSRRPQARPLTEVASYHCTHGCVADLLPFPWPILPLPLKRPGLWSGWPCPPSSDASLSLQSSHLDFVEEHTGLPDQVPKVAPSSIPGGPGLRQLLGEGRRLQLSP